MQIQWDTKVGPASIISLLGALGMLVTIGVMWGQQTTNTTAAITAAAEAKTAVLDQAKKSEQRDRIIGEHSIALGQIQTQLGYVSPALQRIEAKIDSQAKH
jgi:hypothetical protein